MLPSAFGVSHHEKSFQQNQTYFLVSPHSHIYAKKTWHVFANSYLLSSLWLVHLKGKEVRRQRASAVQHTCDQEHLLYYPLRPELTIC